MTSQSEAPPTPEQLEQIGRTVEDILDCIEKRGHKEGGMSLAVVLAALGMVVTRVMLRHCYGLSAVVSWFKDAAVKTEALKDQLPEYVMPHPDVELDEWATTFADRVRWH